jgi:hypothetical protein
MLNTPAAAGGLRKLFPWLVIAAAGQLGGVSGPAGFSFVHPFDGRGGVQAEEVGEHSGGHLGSGVGQGSAASGLDGDAEGAEPVGQPC